MRVAIIHNQLRASGGMESYMLALIRGFQAQGDEVHVHTYEVDQALADSLDCRVHRSNLFFLPRTWKKYFFLSRCNRHFERSQYDLSLALTRTWAADIAVVGGIHPASVARRSRRGHIMRRFHDRMETRFEAAMFARTPLILAHARGLAGEICAWYPETDQEKINVCYPPIDTAFFAPSPEERLVEIRSSYEIQADRLTLLFPSRGHRRKGLAELIQAFSRLDPARFELLVAGEHMRGFGRVPAHVRYIGYVENLSDLYSAVDYTVLPSHYEPFGLAVVESLHCGTPVLVSRQVGAAELLTPAEGVVLDTVTSEALVGAIGGLQKFRVAPGFVKRHGLSIEGHIRAIKNLAAEKEGMNHAGV